MANEFTDPEDDDHWATMGDLEDRIEELGNKVGVLEKQIEEYRSSFISIGYAMGMALAMILSWSKDASILWCMLHGLLSWIYVIYFAIKR